ncbi:MAG: protein kinase [Gammaproteobacteria bacterium]|nr:protein kinase [Gammaproteobacteria bacterium]
MNRPAASLSGLELEDGWKVGEIVASKPEETGGYFSICYNVSKSDGQEGFLKAMDYSGALSAPDPAEALLALTEAYTHERDLLEICHSLSRVVTALGFGTIPLGDPAKAEVVQYIIFELADGSVRSEINGSIRPSLAWTIRSLHQVAVGMRQLHSKRIAHQDLKPSNALFFKDKGLKLADLGRSINHGRHAPHIDMDWPGDWAYAPPEIAYGYLHKEFNVRRLSSDLYLLGSFAVSLLTGMQLTAWIASELPEDMRPPKWKGEYMGTYEQVIPHVEHAYAIALEKIQYQIGIQAEFVDELMECIRELCQPDPKRRGDPQTLATHGNAGNRFNLERYISRFDLLVLKAERYDYQQSQLKKQ